MSTDYKRKKISNLDDLDREEARLRKKTKNIEKEWVELLNPQQLATDFALGFLTNKIAGKASPLKFVSNIFSSKSKEAKVNGSLNTDKGKSKKKKALKIAKGVGIALVAIQAIRLLVGAYQKHQDKKKNKLLSHLQ